MYFKKRQKKRKLGKLFTLQRSLYDLHLYLDYNNEAYPINYKLKKAS